LPIPQIIEYASWVLTGETPILRDSHSLTPSPPLKQLILAADQFIATRATGKTIIAGYPWFGDWGRDTMIALPGLTLTTGRPEIARPILLTFSKYLSQGMLPNAFPEESDTPGYNTVDAILWYFEAIRAYVTATDDNTLLEELFPALEDVIDWHLRGTRYNIHLDESDGLIYAGEPGAQLTWMDAKVDDLSSHPASANPSKSTPSGTMRCCVWQSLPIASADPMMTTWPYQSSLPPASLSSGIQNDSIVTTLLKGQKETILRCAPTSSLRCRLPTLHH